MANVVKGWYDPNPISSNGKYHYFVDHVSLCNRWTNIKVQDRWYDDNIHYHPQNCLNCVRARDKKFGKAEL